MQHVAHVQAPCFHLANKERLASLVNGRLPRVAGSRPFVDVGRELQRSTLLVELAALVGAA
jgi:hypothetical protein